MGDIRTPAGKRALYRLLSFGLRQTARVAGRFSPRLRSQAGYVANLIDEGRHAEVEALLAHVASRLRGARGAGPIQQRLSALRAIEINSADERFDAAGVIRAKVPWVYPSAEAPVLASVVIPCFNYGRFVEEAIASVRAQTLASLEIIVVDDGSTDPATCDVLDRLSGEPSLRILRQPNQGLPTARNNGIAAARGEYVCCLDADDLIEPTYLEVAIAVLRADRATGFAYSHVRMFGDVEKVWETEDFDIRKALIANFTPVSAVFRRDDWREVGGYSPAMLGGFEDWEFWIRLSALGRRGRVIAHPLFLHRRHGRTMTHDAKDRQAELHARIRANNPGVFGERLLRRRIARVASRRGASEDFADLSSAIRRDSRPGLLVVVPWLRRGGAEVLLHSILLACKGDWRIVVATTEADPHPMREEFSHLTAEMFHLDGTLQPKDRIAFLRHLALSREVTHVLASGSAWFLSRLPAFRAGLPPHLPIANILHNEVPDSTFRAAVSAGAALDRHVAVSSRAAQALAAAGVEPGRIAEIRNGIDPAPWHQAGQSRLDARTGLGLAETETLLLWIGRLAPEKRPDAFVEVLAGLAHLPSYRGIVAGEGPLGPAVSASIAGRGLGSRVMQLGHQGRDEIIRLLSAADMLVLTSAFEGMPLVVLEALASGCPVAATDVGDLARLIRPGLDGVLVDPHRPLDLVDAIPRFLSGSAGAGRREEIAGTFANGPYTLSAMQAAYLAMLRSL